MCLALGIWGIDLSVGGRTARHRLRPGDQLPSGDGASALLSKKG